RVPRAGLLHGDGPGRRRRRRPRRATGSRAARGSARRSARAAAQAWCDRSGRQQRVRTESESAERLMSTNHLPPLYPTHRDARLPEAEFRKPGAVYRGTPFWAWNNRLERSQLLRQIGQFQEMGYGGFNLHARTGLQTPYLGEAFLNEIRACTLESKVRMSTSHHYSH